MIISSDDIVSVVIHVGFREDNKLYFGDKMTVVETGDNGEYGFRGNRENQD